MFEEVTECAESFLNGMAFVFFKSCLTSVMVWHFPKHNMQVTNGDAMGTHVRGLLGDECIS